MPEFLKHIAIKRKILFLGFILILVPGAIISYISLKSVSQKAENLRIKYRGTVSLVRDKLESELFKEEAKLRNSITDLYVNPQNDTGLKAWILKLEKENPVFRNMFLISSEGGLLTGSVSLGWNKLPESGPLINREVAINFDLAERAEFVSKNYIDAIRFYQLALNNSGSLAEQTLLLSRTGRCYFKAGQYKSGISEYKKILARENDEITIGKIPAIVTALSQIADGYKTLKDEKEHYNALLELYRQLLNNP